MNNSIRDVAEKADVSIATVSRVIRNIPGVREKTKSKVFKAIKALNYEVNTIARSLRKGKTNTIGIIITNVLSTFHSIIAKSVEEKAKEYGYNMILCNSNDDSEEELNYLKVLKSNRVDGIILISRGKNSNYIKHLIMTGTKIILLDRLIPGVECDSVITDNEESSFNAVKFLIQRGYKRIGIIIAELDLYTSRERFNGYLRALRESKLTKNDGIIKIGGFQKTNGVHLSEEIISSSNRPEALFIGNLDLTLGTVLTIKKMGIKIPEDIGIIGFDDSDWALILDPPLTTVSQPVYELGSTAAELLIKKIEDNLINLNSKPKIITLNNKLIIRGSTK